MLSRWLAVLRLRNGALAVVAGLLCAACGGSPPTQPTPIPPVVTPPTTDPPANAIPTIDGIAVQGRRVSQPQRFADVRESIDVAATVRDPETSVDELTYQWSATLGTFSGSGRAVVWTAPDTVAQPTVVTITLKVVEQFGHPGQPKTFSHDSTSTVTLALHDSIREVGDMSIRFLDRFSQPQTIKDWRDVMRDFKAEACPDPREFDSERSDVEHHYTNFFMHSYTVGAATASVAFGSTCGVPGRNPLRGDACVSVPVRWDSTDLRNGGRGVNIGVDYLAAAYSPVEDRWWLCASQFVPTTTLTHSFYLRR